MVKHYTYERTIENNVVKDLNLHRFDETSVSHFKHAGVNIIRIEADEVQILEWVGVQNCNPIELDPAIVAVIEKEKAKTDGELYGGYKVPFTNADAIGMLQVKAAFEMGVMSTNVEFSNGVVMPMSAADFPAFAAWFVDKRNGYFV